ncbi:MAG: hypothetical protein KAG64_02080 [Bacteroidales bacterium]|nr:hypothetical protein [Bacteroidales bacterium]
MKKIITLVVLATFVLFGTYSCKKYEEGPLISLRTKTARVANDWKLDKAIQDGIDITSNYPEVEQTFEKEGGYKMLFNGADYTGNWEFDSDKEHILIKIDGSSDESKFKIIRLKEKELWLDQTVGSQTIRFFWAPK